MKTRISALSVLALIVALTPAATPLVAAPLGTGFTYQGQLKENGAPMDGTTHLRFSLWDAAGAGSPPVGGSQIGASQLLANTVVANGLFTVALNGGGQFGANAFNGEARWLQIEVCADAGCGTLIVLAPRQPLTATPQALFALNADRLDGLDSSAFLQSLPVPLTLSGNSATHIIRGENASTFFGASGVLGLATAATGGIGITFGGRFESASTSGIGVFGSGGGYGGYFQSASTPGNGVLGYATAATGGTNGVWGQSESTSGRGVVGWATATSGDAWGVYGQSASTSGLGVYGLATAVSGDAWGVYGVSDSTSGRGVTGIASATTGTIYGVYGLASTAAGGYAVFADGDMGASGVKPFRIDHPDDPTNKYLLHYAAESPEVINFYRGTVVLDGAGEAVVELPHYFAKINKTPSYQLTAVGAPMPMLHVAAEIDEAALSGGATAGPGMAAPACTFRIAGGAPGAKVSWRVEAVRNDLWVQSRAVAVEQLRDGVTTQTRAMPVEVEKQGLEKGTYQHPELYGLSAERGMNYNAERERDLPDRENNRPTPRTLPHAMPH